MVPSIVEARNGASLTGGTPPARDEFPALHRRTRDAIPCRGGGMRVGLDATPLLGQRSGVGRYVEGLLSGMAALDSPPELLLTLFSIRGSVPAPLPAGTRPAPRRAPARLLRRTWSRSSWPPVEFLTGRVDAFHGTNFMQPPAARAGGVLTIHDLAFLRYAHTVT